MTPKELMLAALRGEAVDRVPIATYNFHHLSETFRGPSYRPMLDAWLAAQDMGVLCKTPHGMEGGRRELFHSATTLQGDTSVTTTMLETPKGPLQQIHAVPKGQPGYTVEHFIKDDSDVEKLLSLPTTPARPDMSITKAWYERLGDKGLCYVAYGDPMYSVAQWFDFEDFSVRCLVDLPLILELADREWARIQAELAMMLEQSQGYDFLFFTAGPEVATPPMLAPRLFRATVLPYEKQIVRMTREAGHVCAIHCHGRVAMVFDDFKEIGPHALEPLEPPPQGDISLAEALDRAGGMTLMGYIQDQDLYTARPGEMRAKVREICELVKARGGRGYIMTSSATPYMDPPPADFQRNYIEYIQAAQELGA
mgnify:CR=1 FL=1